MALLMFIIGTIFGSFYLVIASRLPVHEDILLSRSRCDKCHKNLRWYHLIPLLSFIIQRGKCTYCHKKISKDHFFVELATGLLFMATFFYFPDFGYNFFVGLIIVSLMIIIFVSDFKYMIILDSPLIIAGILIFILKIIYFDFNTAIYAFLSGLAMFFLMLLIEESAKAILKKDALGGGDIKFSFIMGLTLNLKLSLVSLVLSSFLALPYAVASVYFMKKKEFPYGPFLAGALFVVFFNIDKFYNLLSMLFI